GVFEGFDLEAVVGEFDEVAHSAAEAQREGVGLGVAGEGTFPVLRVPPSAAARVGGDLPAPAPVTYDGEDDAGQQECPHGEDEVRHEREHLVIHTSTS